MQIMLVEILNIFHSVLKVLSGLPSVVLCCPFIANPFHKILKFLAVEVTIQDGQYLVLNFTINFEQGQRRLSAMQNFILNM